MVTSQMRMTSTTSKPLSRNNLLLTDTAIALIISLTISITCLVTMSGLFISYCCNQRRKMADRRTAARHQVQPTPSVHDVSNPQLDDRRSSIRSHRHEHKHLTPIAEITEDPNLSPHYTKRASIVSRSFPDLTDNPGSCEYVGHRYFKRDVPSGSRYNFNASRSISGQLGARPPVFHRGAPVYNSVHGSTNIRHSGTVKSPYHPSCNTPADSETESIANLKAVSDRCARDARSHGSYSMASVKTVLSRKETCTCQENMSHPTKNVPMRDIAEHRGGREVVPVSQSIEHLNADETSGYHQPKDAGEYETYWSGPTSTDTSMCPMVGSSNASSLGQTFPSNCSLGKNLRNEEYHQDFHIGVSRNVGNKSQPPVIGNDSVLQRNHSGGECLRQPTSHADRDDNKANKTTNSAPAVLDPRESQICSVCSNCGHCQLEHGSQGVSIIPVNPSLLRMYGLSFLSVPPDSTEWNPFTLYSSRYVGNLQYPQQSDSIDQLNGYQQGKPVLSSTQHWV